MFQLYYKLQRIVERWEWEDFMSALHQPLPVTFRFARDVSASFRSEGNQLLTAWARRHPRTRELRVVDGWQLHLDKHELRAAEGGSEEAALHRWLVRGSESGMLVRQEVASMLPAVLLDVPADAIVLDMCASPGSKTTQVLEKLGDNGLVVANDSSPLRCNTLARRTGSLGHRSSSLVVTCHPAQAMPRLRDDGFTRIVCDVPCTGDGTTRKHPEVMQRWEVALALRHHPLQLQIALRGASLLQEGGLMCYSTCSLNPIENEAVVAELLRRCGGALEVVDGALAIAEQLAGGAAAGMSTWAVLDFRLIRHASVEELRAAPHVPPEERRLFVRTMWPPPPSSPLCEQLHRCVRLIPHRSDSGGFFVALLRKVAPFPLRSPERPLKPVAAAGPFSVSGRHRSCTPYSRIPQDVEARLERHLAIAAKYPTLRASALGGRLFSCSARASRVVLLTSAAERCCNAVERGDSRLRITHAGAHILKRRRGAHGERPRWLLTPVGRRILKDLRSALLCA